MSRYHVTVSGRVQGVGYRAAVSSRAEQVGLVGWVRNTPDGRVEAEVEGPAAAVEEVITWMRRGPTGARVEGLERREIPAQEDRTFEVR